jgi:hypothetical protein
MAAPQHRQLHIGVDAEKVVVGPRMLHMRAGRATRRRQGSVHEVVPMLPSGRTRDDQTKLLAQLSLILLVLGIVLNALGIVWWQAAAGAVAVLVFVGWQQYQAARVGVIAVPRGHDHQVLYTPEEREAFQRALAVSHRVRRTWPALEHMIDPVDGDRSLTHALEDLAALMVRRQELRGLRADLAGVGHRDLPPGSPAVLALDAQRDRLEELWSDSGAAANRILNSINALALAGENLIREQRIGHTAKAAELAITRLLTGPNRPGVAGPELAERTAAVITAYRELAAWL